MGTQHGYSVGECSLKILDITAGNRAIWFNKHFPGCTYVDARNEVSPDVLADSTCLPASVGEGYDLVVFDPPHKNNGANGGMTRVYGHWTAEQIRNLVRGGAAEAHRVTRPGALMSFKWNNHSNTLERALGWLAPYWTPLVGHGMIPQQRARSVTSWVLLLRSEISA